MSGLCNDGNAPWMVDIMKPGFHLIYWVTMWSRRIGVVQIRPMAGWRVVHQPVSSYEVGVETVFEVVKTRAKKQYGPVLFSLCRNR